MWKIPIFTASTSLLTQLINHEMQLRSDYKWHIVDITKMPNPEEEVLGWEYFSQFEKDIPPLNVELDLRGGNYYFHGVRWEDVKKDIYIRSVVLFNHTLDVPAVWCFLGLTVMAGENIVITDVEMEVN